METYTEYAEKEQEAFEAYRISFAQKQPPPKKQSSISTFSDPEIYLLIIVTVASVLLTSLRTAEQFFLASANSQLGEWLGWTEAVLAIVAVEGSMVIYSMIRARHKKAGYSGSILVAGIIVLAGISVVAALGQSISLMDNPPILLTTSLQWGLMIVIGPGGAIAALIGGHLLGSRMNDLGRANDEGSDEYKVELSEWRGKLERSWNSNRKKYIGDYAAAPTYTEPVNPVPQSRAWGHGELKGAVIDWFTTNRIDIHDTVDYQQVADEIGHHSSETVRVTIAKMRKA